MSICKEWHVPTSWGREKNHQHQLQQHKIQCKCQRTLHSPQQFKKKIIHFVWFGFVFKHSFLVYCQRTTQVHLIDRTPSNSQPWDTDQLDANKSDQNYLRTLGTSLWVCSCILKQSEYTHQRTPRPLTARRASPPGHDQLIRVLPFINDGASENIRGDETQPDYDIHHAASRRGEENATVRSDSVLCSLH